MSSSDAMTRAAPFLAVQGRGRGWPTHPASWPGLTTDRAQRIAESVVHETAADRCVIARFESGVDSVVVATAGRPLCQPGTRLPIELSTMYSLNRNGQTFVGERLDHSAAFRRVSDRALLALGLRSAISIPLWHDDGVAGAMYAAAASARIDARPRLNVAALCCLLSTVPDTTPPSTLGQISLERPSELVQRSVIDAAGAGATAAGPDQISLTDREHQILVELSLGLGSKQVASKLGISPHTVSNHTRAIFRKLSVTCRVDAIRKAHRLSILAWPTA
ncbi:LuxR C-terminal-related transcriptional regulator [Pseudonocardia bannensis]|uniref:HTH luxR-type domain-containing protein n=1 Tax=Pseudonocardia bannensis TaxID=630973 RepID=A0A848DPV2_9PSEU|nr:helix-turn-helix transcriptional regulator [Pseudonocardia bannensis]NMH94565.1 hypothetical protein [Pseudonocardia bannensis]